MDFLVIMCVCTYYTYISNIQIVEEFCREPKCQKMQFRREAVPHWLLQMLKSTILNCFFLLQIEQFGVNKQF